LRPAQQKRNNVSRILHSLMGTQDWHPSLLRKLKTVGDKPDGVLYKMLEAGRTASTVSVYVIALVGFLKFLQVRTEFLTGFCALEEIPSYLGYLDAMQRSASRLRAKHDNSKGVACPTSDRAASLANIGRYNTSNVLRQTFDELREAANDSCNNMNVDIFVRTRDHLMLAIEIWNARRAGDFCHVTVEEWRNARTTDDPDDHIVYVRRHKTAVSEKCPMNFHGLLYSYSKLYVDTFSETCLKCGHLFPKVSGNMSGSAMNESDVNRSLNRAWKSFLSEANDSSLPSHINTRKIRHRAVSALYMSDNTQDMADAVTAMSHSVVTAKTYYNEGDGAAVISRAGRRLRELTGARQPGKSSRLYLLII